MLHGGSIRWGARLGLSSAGRSSSSLAAAESSSLGRRPELDVETFDEFNRLTVRPVTKQWVDQRRAQVWLSPS